MLHKRRLIPRHHSGRYSSLNCSFYWPDRKSTRLNSSHLVISYAVFCLKKKKNTIYTIGTHRRVQILESIAPLTRVIGVAATLALTETQTAEVIVTSSTT